VSHWKRLFGIEGRTMFNKETKTDKLGKKLHFEEDSARFRQLENWMEGQLRLLELAFSDFVTTRSKQSSFRGSR